MNSSRSYRISLCDKREDLKEILYQLKSTTKMQTRITQFITYIRGGGDNNGGEAADLTDADAEVVRATQIKLEELREQTFTIFKNLYWTRIISVHAYDPRADTKWPIAPDLSDEYDVLFQIEEDNLPELNIEFDHVKFSKLNPNPSVDAWRLSDERLE